MAWIGSAAIEVVLDDTLAAKKGPKAGGRFGADLRGEDLYGHPAIQQLVMPV